MPRIVLMSFISFILFAAVRAADPAATPPNTLSDQEMKDGWTLLFDGKNTTGWRQLGADKFPSEQWVVRDGALITSRRPEDLNQFCEVILRLLDRRPGVVDRGAPTPGGG